MVGVAAKVQDLHGDLAARVVYRLRYHLVFVGFLLRGHACAAGQGAAPVIGGDAAGDDQAHAAACALGIKSGHALKAVFGFLQAHMHRAHDDAVLEFGKTQVQGLEQMGVMVHADVLDVFSKNKAAGRWGCAGPP